MFTVNFARVKQLNELGGKDNRMQKLQEEQGELAQAILDCNPDDVVAEGVDVLLMLLSILADVAPTVSHVDQWADAGMEMAYMVHPSIQYNSEPIQTHYLRTCSLIGRVAEANQRLDGIASSNYKNDGGFDAYTTAAYRTEDLQRAMCNIFDIFMYTGVHIDEIQKVYNEKMDKWERVSK